MLGLAILSGVMVGFALGLTGSGGGIFAVPLLVFGLHVPPREAIGISLAAVGGTALLGVLPRLKQGEVEISAGAAMALTGIGGAPLGTYLSNLIRDDVLLLLFSGLMVLIALQMWRKSFQGSAKGLAEHHAQPAAESPGGRGPWCPHSPDGRLTITVRCALMLGAMGFATGVLSGMFGVGGGFIIVPALVLLSGMSIHQAVGTSLMVIVLVSISGVSSYLLRGEQLSLQLTLLFILGGFLGMQLGTRLARYLSGATLQRVFAAAILLVAVFVVVKSTLSPTLSDRPRGTAAGSSPSLVKTTCLAGPVSDSRGVAQARLAFRRQSAWYPLGQFKFVTNKEHPYVT